MGNCGCKFVENNSDIIVPTESQTRSTLSVTENNPLMSQTQNQIISTESSSATKSDYKFSSSCFSSVSTFTLPLQNSKKSVIKFPTFLQKQS